jgi:hypothetical protein
MHATSPSLQNITAIAAPLRQYDFGNRNQRFRA